ncbi:hypothetical protein CLAIMM_12437 isoform 2 [Cladophialophora immunda]|nr:hypothetical protein CLAIMM_12437 isoform 2 [Cladophialophora immunda]
MPLDPLSAIGLAANIVQFIDFGRELISDAKEIYHSANGATAENVELQGVAENLARLSSTLMKPLDPTQGAISEAEAEIVKIAASSSSIADELLATIKNLKIGEGPYKKWRSFRQALNTIWKKDKIARLQRRLEDARSNLSIHVLSFISVRQGQVLRSLEGARTACLEIDSARLQRIEPMLESLRGLVQSGRELTAQYLAQIDQKLRSSDYETTKLRKEAGVLKSLMFERMAARWPSCDPRSRIRFHEWFTHGDGIYWVSGKPGSGKSTLMKYLRDCQQTKQCLQVWANNDRLVMAGFFFWISELKGAFNEMSLMNVNPGNSSKLCLFVDGLDEYHGDPLDLIKIIQNIAQIDNVKICASSRPWNCFEDAFGQDAQNKLYLQDLTRDDIVLYVKEKLEEVPNFSLLRQDVVQIERLISEIVSRAQGVFLWVYLVSRSLREGLINGDSLTLLYERLLEMPSDLEEFFEKLIRSVDKVYRTRMAHTFRVALATPEPLRLTLYSFIDEGSHILRPSTGGTDKGSFSNREIFETEEAMSRQLNGRYKGLLEPVGEPGSREVDFLHRTVRDFLATTQMQRLFASYSAVNFNASVLFVREGADPYLTQEYPGQGSLSVSEVSSKILHHNVEVNVKFKAVLGHAMRWWDRPSAQHWRPRGKREHAWSGGRDTWSTDDEARKQRRLESRRQRRRGRDECPKVPPHTFEYKRRRPEEGGRRYGSTRRNEWR